MTHATTIRKHTPTATIRAEELVAGATIVTPGGDAITLNWVGRNKRGTQRVLCTAEGFDGRAEIPLHAPVTIYVKREG